MSYTPGLKARAEFRAFSRGRAQLKLPNAGRPIATLGVEEERSAYFKQRIGTSAEGQSRASVDDPARLAVQRFHKLARGVTDYAPAEAGKELRQASELLSKYGSRRVDFLLEFAVDSAKRTKFRMRTFGALLQYVSEAIAEYERIDRNERARHRAREEHEARLRRDDEELGRAKDALKSLSPEQYRALYERVKSDIVTRYPNIVTWKGQTIFDRMIMLKMAEALDERGLKPA